MDAHKVARQNIAAFRGAEAALDAAVKHSATAKKTFDNAEREFGKFLAQHFEAGIICDGTLYKYELVCGLREITTVPEPAQITSNPAPPQ